MICLTGKRSQPDGAGAGRSHGSWRAFPGVTHEVPAARCFARTEFGDHPAATDAVLVVSELCANAVMHTSSGQRGGIFLVHLTTLSRSQVAVLVTDEGSRHEPRLKPVGATGESGRGLAVVTALADLFIPFGGPSGRTILAVVGTFTGQSQSSA